VILASKDLTEFFSFYETKVLAEDGSFVRGTGFSDTSRSELPPGLTRVFF
jgi:hypothetical protein